MSIIKTLSKAPTTATHADVEKLLQVLTDLESSGLWVFPAPSFTKKGFEIFGSKVETISVTEGDEKVTFTIQKEIDTYTVKTVYENNTSSWSTGGTVIDHHRQFHEESNRLFTEEQQRNIDTFATNNHGHMW